MYLIPYTSYNFQVQYPIEQPTELLVIPIIPDNETDNKVNNNNNICNCFINNENNHSLIILSVT